MPFDNLPYASLFETMGFVPMNHSAPQLFPTSARKLFDETGEELPGYRRLVRDDTGKTLNVVTDSYEFIDNRVIFEAFEQAINASTLDTKDLIVATDYGNEGAKVFRQYVFPGHSIEVKPGVTVALRVTMFNSYDRTTAFSGRAGAFVWVCANTAHIGKEIGNFKLRHAGEVDVDGAVKGLIGAAESHVTATKRMKEWPRIDISDGDAKNVLCSVPKISNQQADRLVHSWLIARDAETVQAGPNLWTLFGVLSAWSSFGDNARGAFGNGERDPSSARLRFDREKQVAAVLDAEVWTELES